MILEIGSDDSLVKIDVTAAAGARKVTLNGREVTFDWVRLPDGQYSLILDGKVFDFIIDMANGSCSVTGRHGAVHLNIRDPRRLLRQREVEEGPSGLQRLTAEMPGKVIRVLVREGDPVAYDQGLLVLEAMKMQNEIRAPKGGTVREIGVAAGKTVNTGEFLLSLE